VDYKLKVDEAIVSKDASIEVTICKDGIDTETFFIAVDTDNYNIIGYTASIDIVWCRLTIDEYKPTTLIFGHDEQVGVKPDIESKFMYYEYETYELYNKWYKELDENQFKKKLEKAIIDSVL